MIAKSLNAGSTKGTILYAGEKKEAELVCANDVFGSPKSIANQFKHVQQLNTRTEEKNKTFHSTISLHPDDKGKLSKEQEIQLIKDYAKMLNLDKNQYVAYKHTDTEKPHFHFVANRINEDTKKATNLYRFKDNHMIFCKEQEQKLNLTIAIKEENIVTIGNKEVVIPDNSQIESLKEIVQRNLKESKNLKELEERLDKENIKTYKKGTGISFMNMDNKVIFNGSKLDRSLSLKGIEKQLENQKALNKIELAVKVHSEKYPGKIPNISYNPEHLNKELQKKFDFQLTKEEIKIVHDKTKELSKEQDKGMSL